MNDKAIITIRDLFVDRIDDDHFNLRYTREDIGNLSQEKIDLIRFLDELVDCLMRCPAHMIVQRSKGSNIYRIRFKAGSE